MSFTTQINNFPLKNLDHQTIEINRSEEEVLLSPMTQGWKFFSKVDKWDTTCWDLVKNIFDL